MSRVNPEQEERWVVRATFYGRLSVEIGKVKVVKTTKTMVYTHRSSLVGHGAQHSIERTKPHRGDGKLKLTVNPLHGSLFFHATEANAREHAAALCDHYAEQAEREATKLQRAARLFAGTTTTTTEDLDDEDSEVTLDHDEDDHQGEG